MKIFILLLVMIGSIATIWFLAALPLSNISVQSENPELLALSENLLYNVKTDQPTDSFKLLLAKYSVNDILTGLTNDNARKSFWINIYNAYYQILASEHQLKPPKIFSEKAIQFADASFSLDDVEHGILRRYRWKYSLGYLPQRFPKKIIKQLAVEKIDYRIHFALNCGAKSCPPIAFYNYEKIDGQLDIATSSFLESETEFDDQNKTVYVTKIMQWFIADFGGNVGILNLLQITFGRSFSNYKIKYKDYDWNPSLKNFTSAENKITLQSSLTCPHCGFTKNETMPTDACLIYYQCNNCKAELHHLPEHCCVFCSYGSVKCPPEQ